jgi:hypothetical protein
MIDKLIAYNLEELKKHKLLTECNDLQKSGFLNQEQWQNIQARYKCELFHPAFFMRILFFIIAIIGMFTVIGPFALMLGDMGEGGYRFMMTLLGIGLLVTTEKVLINTQKHYKSGITEAGIYAGLAFVYMGVLGFDGNNLLPYILLGLVFSAFVAIRYLNLIAVAATLYFIGWFLFDVSTETFGIAQAILPFTFMAVFGTIYWLSRWAEDKLQNCIFNNQFIIIQSIALFVIYAAGNYFVVRELSVNQMHLHLADGQNIPFAYLFYLFTAIIPFFYVYWGLRKRSLLFLRVGLLTIALSVITLKYYFSLGMPVVTITAAGAIMIALSLWVMKYLKTSRHGYTRELIFKDKWMTSEVTGIIASQTLGGNSTGVEADSNLMQGGKFGGGGAGQSW